MHELDFGSQSRFDRDSERDFDGLLRDPDGDFDFKWYYSHH